jgi:hypothetical protein
VTGVALIVAAVLVAWWATATWRPPGARRAALPSPVVRNLEEVASRAVEALESAYGWAFAAAGDAVSRRADGTERLDTLERGSPGRVAPPYTWGGVEAVSGSGELVVVAGAVHGDFGVVGVTYGVRPGGVPSRLTVTCEGEVWCDGQMLCPGLVGDGDEEMTAARVYAVACEGAGAALERLGRWGIGVHTLAVVGGELRVRVAAVVTRSTDLSEVPDWPEAIASARELAKASWDERMLRPGQLARRMLRSLSPDGSLVRELARWMRAEGGEVAEIAQVELIQLARGGEHALWFALALELVPDAALEVFGGDPRPLGALDTWYALGGKARGEGFARWVTSLKVSEYDSAAFGVPLKLALWRIAYGEDGARAGLPGMLRGLLLEGGASERAALLRAIAGAPPVVLKEVLKVPVRVWLEEGGRYDVVEEAVRRVGEVVSQDGVGAEVDHFLATVLARTWRVPEASPVVERVIALMSVAGRRESVELLEHLSREGGLGGASRLARGALKTLRGRTSSGALTVSVGEGGELTVVGGEAGGLTPADE